MGRPVQSSGSLTGVNLTLLVGFVGKGRDHPLGLWGDGEVPFFSSNDDLYTGIPELCRVGDLLY